MAVFYILPPRVQVGHHFQEFLASMFPGQSWLSSDWPDLAEALPDSPSAELPKWTRQPTRVEGVNTFVVVKSGRFATYNELLRPKAERHGVTIVDYWRMREYRDWRLWDPDRMHMGPEGHQVMAIAVLDALGVSHDLQPLPLSEDSDGLSAALTDREWARAHLAPWLLRRVRRESSGDDLSARRPELAPMD